MTVPTAGRHDALGRTAARPRPEGLEPVSCWFEWLCVPGAELGDRRPGRPGSLLSWSCAYFPEAGVQLVC